jgi:hypothetical protein
MKSSAGVARMACEEGLKGWIDDLGSGRLKHKTHKDRESPVAPGLFNQRAQTNGFVITHPFAAPFIVVLLFLSVVEG